MPMWCLARLIPHFLQAAKLPLQADAAKAALQKNIGDKLDLKDFWSAAGVAEIVDENMANAARVHAIELGRDLAGCTMIAFGGGAPLHATRLAEKTGITPHRGAGGCRCGIGHRLPAGADFV